MAPKRPWKTLLLVTAFVGGLVAPSTTSASGAACAPTPTLREADFNQGLPYRGSSSGNPILAAGKDTIVKLHLTLPDCALGQTNLSARISSATLSATGVGTFNAAPITDNVAPCCAAAPNSYGDPKFVIAGAAVSAVGSVSFTATLNYTSSAGSGQVVLNGTTIPDSRLVAGFYDTNLWKTLIVPMGYPAQGYSTWFPTTSPDYRGVVLESWQAASRMLPVRAGVCASIPDPVANPTLAASCGIQYTISGDLANVGPGGSNDLPLDRNGQPTTPFCGGDTFQIAAELDKSLQAYNLANPTHQANNVTGVIPDSKSSGCTAQGAAIGGGDASWVRLVTDANSSTTGGISVSGAVLAQEQMHNRNLEFNSNAHSAATRADGAYPHRFINTVSTNWDDNNRTNMNTNLVGIAANNANSGTEAQDWKCLLVGLAASDASGCPATGSNTPAASQSQTFSISGRVTGGGTSAQVTSVSFSDNQERGLDNTSDVKVVFMNTSLPTPDIRSQGILVGGTATHTMSSSTTDGDFDAAMAMPAGTNRIELRRGTQTLWLVNTTTGPTNVQVFVRPDRYGFGDLGAGTDPSVSPFSQSNNVLVTWVGGACTATGGAAGSKLMVERAAGGQSSSTCIAPSPVSPHFGPGNNQIYYVTKFNSSNGSGGDIKAVAFTPAASSDPSTSPGTFGAVTSIYTCAPSGAVCQRAVDQFHVGPATDLDVSDGGSIVFSALQPTSGGDLFFISDPTQSVIIPNRLTLTSQDERAGSFSHTAGQTSKAVFEQCANETTTTCSLFTLDTSNAGVTQPATTPLGVQGHSPSWGNGFVAAEQNGTVVTIFPEDADVAASTRQVTGSGTDHTASSFDPSLRGSGGPVAFESNGDIWVANSSNVASEVSVVATDPDGSWTSGGQNGPDFAEIYAELPRNADGSSPCAANCWKDRTPVGVVVPQASREGDKVTFHKVVDLAAVPAGAVAQAGVSDYFNTGTSFGNPIAPSFDAAPKLQNAVISYPIPGSVVPSNQPLWFDGSASDLELGTEDYASGNTALSFTWTDENGVVLSHLPRFSLPAPPVGTHTYTLTVTDQASQKTVTSTASSGVTVEKAAASAVFQPDTYQVPSNGVLTYYATLSGLAAAGVKVKTAAITKVNGVSVTAYGVPGLPFTATWSNSGDSFTFKISRDTGVCTTSLAPPGSVGTCQSPNNFLLNNNLVNGQINVFTLEGTLSNGQRFIVEDTDHPTVIPA